MRSEAPSGRAGPPTRPGPTSSFKETSMSFGKTVLLVALSMTTLAAPLAFAADGDAMQSFSREVQTMTNKDGMVTKKDFMAMMEKKWNSMDKANKGMLSTADVMRIFSDTKGQ
jgi:hypothetical protein